MVGGQGNIVIKSEQRTVSIVLFIDSGYRCVESGDTDQVITSTFTASPYIHGGDPVSQYIHGGDPVSGW